MNELNIGKSIHGTTAADELDDGIEFTADLDFDPATDENFMLTLTTARGKNFLFFGPELDDYNPGTDLPLSGSFSIRPTIEKLGPRRFRLRLNETHLAIVRQHQS